MAYQVLARKYRPLLFSDVAGQDHVTRTLMNAITQGRIAHGYIFSGHRGIGKTTIARILASALNCHRQIGTPERPTAEPCLACDSCLEIRQGNAVDVLEIDAATNRGIDEIRELRDAARYRPARDKYKIYILDEAHQITDAAFNALLKTLEEPPDHIIFMMATTEPENIPQTIRSRCQHFSFHAVKFDDILQQIRGIAEQEQVDADDSALALLAEAGDGSMRDALSIMDQAIASAPVAEDRPVLDATQIRDLMGTVSNTIFEQILEAVSQNQTAEVITITARLLDAGNSPQQIARQMVRYLRNVLMAKVSNLTPESESSELLQVSPEERRRAARTAMLFSEEELTRFLQMMLRTFDDLGFRQEQRFHLELGLIKLVHLQRLLPVEELLSAFPKAGSNAPKPSSAKAGLPVASTRTPVATPPERSAAPVAPRPSQATASPTTAPASQPVQAPPSLSPFAPKAEGKEPPASVPAPRPQSLVASPAPEATTRIVPATEVAPTAVQRTEPVVASPSSPFAPKSEPAGTRPMTVGSLAVAEAVPSMPPIPASEDESAPDSEAEQLRTAVTEALFAASNQTSAAEKLEDSEWSIAAGELRVQTDLSPAMLKTIFRPETEALIKQALKAKDVGGLKLVLLPADKSKPKAEKATKTARAGSVQALASEHPIVQRAQQLFKAEITTVRDLRK